MATALSGKNSATPVTHAVPNITSPTATGMTTARSHHRSSPILKPNPAKFFWNAKRVTIAATAGDYMRKTVEYRTSPEVNANCGLAAISTRRSMKVRIRG